MRYFSFIAQIFHLSFPTIWQAHSSIKYFSQKYKKRKSIPKSFKALAVILKLLQALELLVIFSRFSKYFLKTPLHKSVAMET